MALHSVSSSVLRRSMFWAILGLAISMTGCASFRSASPSDAKPALDGLKRKLNRTQAGNGRDTILRRDRVSHPATCGTMELLPAYHVSVAKTMKSYTQLLAPNLWHLAAGMRGYPILAQSKFLRRIEA